jgi:predicted membrane protein
MNSFFNQFSLITFIIFTIIFFGCEKKQEAREVKEEAPVEMEQAPVEEAPEEEVEEEAVITVPDLKGTWTGKFDSRATVLNINEQTDTTFSGKITISYREVINQEVSGTISPSTMKINMKDMLHSRYRGIYSGTLSDDGTAYSGTFTQDLDKTKFQFSLSKKQ